jgi:hypothetical protein
MACSDPNDIDVICKNETALCRDLNEDKWCVPEKEALIRSRFQLQQSDQAFDQYVLLKSLNKFQECIKIVALIEPRQHSELKTKRVLAMLNTYNELISLELMTADSENPYLLYYHWQYLNDDEAKHKLLKQSQEQAFDSAELQFALANIYSNTKTQKTINSLLKGIALVEDDHKMTTSLLYSLITVYMHKRQYKLAYLWSRVATILDVENINLSLFDNTDKVTSTERVAIDKLAIFIAKQIVEQKFAEENYQTYLSSAEF